MILYGERRDNSVLIAEVSAVSCDGVTCDFQATPQSMKQHLTVSNFRRIQVHDREKSWTLHEKL